MGKLLTLEEAIRPINDGAVIALGGNVLHRAPIGAILELIAQGKNDLHIVKTAGAHDVDLLCAFGRVKEVTFGFISYEAPYGFCSYFRRAVEKGLVRARENACYTVITGLRAAAYGVGFLPVRGLDGSDLQKSLDIRMVENPYSGENYVAIPALRPDFAIIHVQEADIHGNCKIYGPKYEDPIMARAARNVIATAERIVEPDIFRISPDYADIPGNLVTAVVELPNGALPGSCAGIYTIDDYLMRLFLKANSPESLNDYVRILEEKLTMTD